MKRKCTFISGSPGKEPKPHAVSSICSCSLTVTFSWGSEGGEHWSPCPAETYAMFSSSLISPVMEEQIFHSRGWDTEVRKKEAARLIFPHCKIPLRLQHEGVLNFQHTQHTWQVHILLACISNYIYRDTYT